MPYKFYRRRIVLPVRSEKGFNNRGNIYLALKDTLNLRLLFLNGKE